MMHNLIILSFALVCTAAPVQEVPSDYEPTSAAQIPEQELFEDHRGGADCKLAAIFGCGDCHRPAAFLHLRSDIGRPAPQTG